MCRIRPTCCYVASQVSCFFMTLRSAFAMASRESDAPQLFLGRGGGGGWCQLCALHPIILPHSQKGLKSLEAPNTVGTRVSAAESIGTSSSLDKKLWSGHKKEPHVKLVDALCKLQSRERGKRSLCCSHELAVSLATSHLLSIIF